MQRKKNDYKMYSITYRLYPSFTQEKILDHTCFIYNQAYNICIDKLKEYYSNKEKFPNTNTLRKEIQNILQHRKLKYNSKVVQFAVDNCKSNYYKYQKPNYKISRKLANTKQSFIIDNQSFSFIQKDKNNSYLTLFRQNIKLKLHKKMSKDIFHPKMISVKKNNCNQWFVAITFDIIDFDKFKEINKIKYESNNMICAIDTNKDNITLHSNNINKKFKDKINKLKKGQLKTKKHKNYITINLENTKNDIDNTKHKDNKKKIELETILNTIYEKYTQLMIKEYKVKYNKEYIYYLYKTYEKDGKKYIKINKKNKKPELNKESLQRIITLLKDNKHDYKKYLKAYYAKNKLRLKTNNIKQDKINKTNNLLMSCLDTFVIEKLNSKKMKMKSSSDKKLRKKLQSSQFGKYLTMITLGARLYEKQLIKVAPAYTSSTCHYCGYIHKKEDKNVWRPTQNIFICQNCNNTYNADENAATNIYMLGLASLERETRDFSHG